MQVPVPWQLVSEPRRPPAVPYSQSWRTNIMRLWCQGRVIDVSPDSTSTRSASPSEAFPGCEEVFVIPTWNPGRSALPLGRNVFLRDWAVRLLDDSHVESHRAVLMDSERLWAEDSLALIGQSRTDTKRSASWFGQPVFLRWDGEGFTALTTGLMGGLEPSMRDDAVPVVVSTARNDCSMLTPPGEGCAPRGGGYTQASREAEVEWREHRTMLTHLLGCNVCGRSRRLFDDDSLDLNNLRVPTRDGGWEKTSSVAPSLLDAELLLGWVTDGLSIDFLDWTITTPGNSIVGFREDAENEDAFFVYPVEIADGSYVLRCTVVAQHHHVGARDLDATDVMKKDLNGQYAHFVHWLRTTLTELVQS